MLHQIATLQFFMRRSMHGAASNQGNRTKYIQIAPIVRAYGHAYVRSCGERIKIGKTAVLTATLPVDDFLRTEYSHKIFRIIFLYFFYLFSHLFIGSSSIKNETKDRDGTGKKTNRRTFISMTILICHLWFVTAAKRHQILKKWTPTTMHCDHPLSHCHFSRVHAPSSIQETIKWLFCQSGKSFFEWKQFSIVVLGHVSWAGVRLYTDTPSIN